MRKKWTLVGSLILAVIIGVALFLRPKRLAREELPTPAGIPETARQVLRLKMGRHDQQMQALLSRVVLLDAEGVARAAGEIFDEPALARPLTGEELNGLLPERFFVLQDELRARARRLVTATLNKDRATLADEFAELAKTCVACHQLYLYGQSAP